MAPTTSLWYAAGSTADALWWGRPAACPSSAAVEVNGTYEPVVTDVQGDGADDIMWYGPGNAADRWYRWTSGRVQSVSSGITITGTYVPVTGAVREPRTGGRALVRRHRRLLVAVTGPPRPRPHSSHGSA